MELVCVSLDGYSPVGLVCVSLDGYSPVVASICQLWWLKPSESLYMVHGVSVSGGVGACAFVGIAMLYVVG